ncbi:MAG: nuclear transport factor 2 family protein [Acidobacteriota bacterium]
MKRIIVIAMLMIAASSITTGQTSGKRASQNGDAEQAIRQLVSELVNAQLKGDTATLDRIWADDFTFTNSSGEVQTKAQRLTEIKSGELKFVSMSIDDVQVRVYGDAAVVTSRGTVKGQRRGQDLTGQSRGTSVYVKKQGRWQVVAQQVTRIAQQ